MGKKKLAPDIERLVIQGMIDGDFDTDFVSPEELSHEGNAVRNTISGLCDRGSRPPFALDDIRAGLCQVFGLDPANVDTYMRALPGNDDGQTSEGIAALVKTKRLLADIIDTATDELASGELNTSRIQHLLDSAPESRGSLLAPFSTQVDTEPPDGVPLHSLPELSKLLNGLYGIWVIGGTPGLGKSTLAWQIALDVCDRQPVLYYDLDGTGEPWLMKRTKTILGKQDIKEKLKQFYVRTDINTLRADLKKVPPPALVVIDSFQTLPTPAERRVALDRWASHFKRYAAQGYQFILVSEVPRDKYGEVGMSVFKETGGLEYAGSVCAVLTQPEEYPEDTIVFNIVKSRHSLVVGKSIELVRDSRKVFWFSEEEETGGFDDEL